MELFKIKIYQTSKIFLILNLSTFIILLSINVFFLITFGASFIKVKSISMLYIFNILLMLLFFIPLFVFLIKYLKLTYPFIVTYIIYKKALFIYKNFKKIKIDKNLNLNISKTKYKSNCFMVITFLKTKLKITIFLLPLKYNYLLKMLKFEKEKIIPDMVIIDKKADYLIEDMEKAYDTIFEKLILRNS